MPTPTKPTPIKPLQPPKFPATLSTLRLPAGRFQDDEEYIEGRLNNLNLSGQQSSGTSLRQVRAKQINLGQSRFSDLRLVDVSLEGCDLANAHWERSSGQRIELISCQLLGFAAPEAYWQDLLLRECNGTFAQFRFANLRGARFEACDFTDADFHGADLSGVIFHHCNLTNVELSQAKLVGADLRTATIEGLKAGAKELPGAIVTPIQGAYLASRLGLVIKHVDE